MKIYHFERYDCGYNYTICTKNLIEAIKQIKKYLELKTKSSSWYTEEYKAWKDSKENEYPKKLFTLEKYSKNKILITESR